MWHEREERKKLDERLNRIESKVNLILRCLALEWSADHGFAISAKGELNMLNVSVGDKGIIFTYKEFDGLQGAGNLVKPSGPINFASDNQAVATVDSTAQVLNADGSVTVPIVAVGAGTANITGVDSASLNKVAAGDILTVKDVPPPPPPPPAPALSATGVLSIATPTASSTKV